MNLRKIFCLLISCFFISSPFFCVEPVPKEVIDEWRKNPDSAPHGIDGWMFYVSYAADGCTSRRDAIDSARSNIYKYFSMLVYTEVSGSTSFTEHLEGSDNFDDELESWAKMDSDSYERTYAELQGIDTSNYIVSRNDDGTWDCVMLGYMSEEEFEKAKADVLNLVADENAARSIYGYFENEAGIRGLSDFNSINQKEDSYRTWIQKNCIRISCLELNSDNFMNILKSFIEKMFRDSMYMQSMFEKKSQLVVYDSGSCLKKLLDGLNQIDGVRLFDQNGNAIVLSCSKPSEFRSAVGQMKDSGSIVVFLNEEIVGKSKFDAAESVRRFRGIAEASDFSIIENKTNFSDRDYAIEYSTEHKIYSSCRYVAFISVVSEYKKGDNTRIKSRLSTSLEISIYDSFLEKLVFNFVSDKKTYMTLYDFDISSIVRKHVSEFFDEGGVNDRLRSLFSNL